ncbi:hypothetical protein E6H33_00895 [Candidatus Bathyarchaeota archaeon]|nr:MAG: hypothetical protein E6H33_00895 [Candidatus Bathyarchaeota archaeon]
MIEQVVQLDAKPHDVFVALLDPVKHSDFTGSPAPTSGGLALDSLRGTITFQERTSDSSRTRRSSKNGRRPNGLNGYPPSKLEFILIAKNGRTEPKMVHSKVPAEQVEDYRRGWYDSYWNPLKKYLERARP